MLWPGRLKEIRFVWNSMDWQLLSTWKVWYNWYDFIKHSSNYFGTIMLMSNRASCSCVNLNVRVFISEFVSVNVVILALFIISHSRRWSVQMNIYTIMCHAQWRGSMKPLLRVTVENSVCWNTQEHSGTRRNTQEHAGTRTPVTLCPECFWKWDLSATHLVCLQEKHGSNVRMRTPMYHEDFLLRC